IAAYDWYGWDVSAAVSAPGGYAFAIVPEATDVNGAHFFSKEGSSTFTPYLAVEYSTTGGGGEGGSGGGGGDPGDCMDPFLGCTTTSTGASTGGSSGDDG